jgi:hypothetical protein
LVDAKVVEKYPQAFLDEWEKASKILEKEVPPIREALTQRFRDILGIFGLTKKGEKPDASTP